MNFNQSMQIVTCETWIIAIASSAAIGCTSLVPWLFNLTFLEQHKQVQSGSARRDDFMKYLLSFAIGAILGDIFFHLIPESYHSHLVELGETHNGAHKKVGVSIISGIFMFIIVEMVLEKWSKSDASITTELPKPTGQQLTEDQEKTWNQNDFKLNQTKYKHNDLNSKQTFISKEIKTQSQLDYISNSNTNNNNNNNHEIKNFNNNNIPSTKYPTKVQSNLSDIYLLNNDISSEKETMLRLRKKEILLSTDHSPVKPDVTASKVISEKTVNTAGYLSLIANGFDNFTHGLAIGASFLVGPKVGLLTTFVIFIHEIPHEICDYAILLKSGFSRLEAVKANFSVSLFGILGTATALYVKSIETLNSKTCWILPFSAGGFLYIALVNLLPEILDRQTDRRNTIGQVLCVILGILFMAFVAII